MKKIILSLFLFSATSISSFAQTWAAASLDINGVKAQVNSNGDLFWNYAQSRFEVPKGGGAKTIFAGALWVGGLDTAGQLHLGAQTYRQMGNDFYPGPVMNSGNYSAANDALWNNVWKINKSTIDSFRLGLFSVIPNVIATWPGNGDMSQGQAAQLADYVDTDGDGFYNPSAGDYPCIKGDQAVLLIFNDDRNTHGETGGQKMKFEFHAMLYAYAAPGTWLDTVVFLNYKMYNRSATTYHSAYIGTFMDFDIGAYDDDYVGCDVKHDMFYGYNGDANDGWSAQATLGTYGANPPAQGVMFLRGPLADTMDGIDNNHDGTLDEPGEFCTMSKFIYYNNDFSVTGNPVIDADYYNYMKGIWKDGTPLTYDGNGYGGSIVCDAMFPGISDPNGWDSGGLPQAPWSEETVGNTPGDRRGFASSGPFTITPGQEMCLDFAFIFGRGNNGPASGIAAIESYADSVRAFYPTTSPCSCVINPLSVNEISNAIHFEVYPNPASDNMNVSYQAKNADARLDIYDMTGKIVLSEKITRTLTCIDMKKFSNGIYLLRVIDGTNTGTAKVIKE